MAKVRRYNFSIEGEPLYPHIKLTAERFPRLLSTRIVDPTDLAQYFGPFLTRSAARILIDFLNRTFRLRSCTIPVDGSFEVPCTQYYAKRCLAPCVAAICGRETYVEMAELATLFLSNERERFESRVFGYIDEASKLLDFERAADFRDILESVREFWATKRRDVWLDDAVDTFLLEHEADLLKVFIVTTRKGRMLGSRVFVFQVFDETDTSEVLSDVIEQFYPVNAPREIRVPFDFAKRHELAHTLSDRLEREVRIVARGEKPERVTALLALARTKLSVELEKLKPVVTTAQIQRELKRLFGLKKLPSRIEAFDAAHISGSFAAAAMSVWKNAELIAEEYRQTLSTETGEIATLRNFIADRLNNDDDLPQLIVIDGGRSHLNAALNALEQAERSSIEVIGAVKPPRRHDEISHFLTTDGNQIDFDYSSPAMRLLKVLRDEAHDLANAAHGQSRDMAHFYTASGRQPLIVPIRYDDPNGKAGDLRPINSGSLSRRR